MGFEVWGLGSVVWGLELQNLAAVDQYPYTVYPSPLSYTLNLNLFTIRNMHFVDEGSVSRLLCSGFRVHGTVFGVRCSGFRIQGSGCTVHV